jgi:hypothetical protein
MRASSVGTIYVPYVHVIFAGNRKCLGKRGISHMAKRLHAFSYNLIIDQVYSDILFGYCHQE